MTIGSPIRLLVLFVAVVFTCSGGQAGEPVPSTSLEADNRAVLAGLASDAPIVVNGEFSMVQFVDLVAQHGKLKFSLAERYTKAPVRVRLWSTTVIEAFVWLGNECGFCYRKGGGGELVIAPAKTPPESRCVNEGAGILKAG